MSLSPSSLQWKPKRTLDEVDKIMCGPGMPHETETSLVNGRVYRVYKNLWTSMRDFWLSSVDKYSDQTYVVFEDQRLTFGEVHERATETAALFRNVYAVNKGDRVGICSRNCPEYLIVFWACHLLGAVTVLANAWIPAESLKDCLVRTQCKLLLFDIEWADRLKMELGKLCQRAGATGVLVFDDRGGGRDEKAYYQFLDSVTQRWNSVTTSVHKDAILSEYLVVLPEDNATILFTLLVWYRHLNKSVFHTALTADPGTTGKPKGVLSTNRQYLTNALNVTAAATRASLRRGGDILPVQSDSQRSVLVPLPFFHVSGSTSFVMLATLNGSRLILMPKWDAENAARLIKTEKVALAGGVPAMISDLLRSSLVGYPLEGILFGGSPSPESLAERARVAFPTAVSSQVYGLSEINSIAVSISGEDYLSRPGSTGRACPVNDVLIMKKNKSVGTGEVGEVWLRGPNVMKEYWDDPDATAKVLTSDGWLKTGDLGMLDAEGFLYIKDRIKDVIIRGGENIASVTVENALYIDSRVLEAAAVAVHDERLGELVAAVVYLAPESRGQVTEDSLIALARSRLPRFAVPVMVHFADRRFDLTPSGKIIKAPLRKLANRAWEVRKAGIECKAKL